MENHGIELTLLKLMSSKIARRIIQLKIREIVKNKFKKNTTYPSWRSRGI